MPQELLTLAYSIPEIANAILGLDQFIMHLLFCKLTSGHEKGIAVRTQLRYCNMLVMIESTARQYKKKFPGKQIFTSLFQISIFLNLLALI